MINLVILGVTVLSAIAFIKLIKSSKVEDDKRNIISDPGDECDDHIYEKKKW